MRFKIPPYILILVIIIIIGGLIFVFKYFDKASEKKLGNKASAESFKDSDNDGLRDWEEELYRTDPFKPDTDGDGYLDGEEINSGNNPLVKAPGDELKFHPLPLGEKYNLTNKILDETSVQKLLSSYLSQKAEYLKTHPEISDPDQFSALTDPSKIQEMAEKSIYESYDTLNEAYVSDLAEIFDISISDEEIKISADNSKEAINLYISKISEWLNSNVFFFRDEALQIVSNAFKNQDFNNLDRLIKLNDKWIDQMKEIIVPSSWKEIHKEGLKIIILTRNVFVSLRDFENDPFKAYYAVEKLEEIAQQWTELIKKAIDLAKNQEIALPL